MLSVFCLVSMKLGAVVGELCSRGGHTGFFVLTGGDCCAKAQ